MGDWEPLSKKLLGLSPGFCSFGVLALARAETFTNSNLPRAAWSGPQAELVPSVVSL